SDLFCWYPVAPPRQHTANDRLLSAQKHYPFVVRDRLEDGVHVGTAEQRRLVQGLVLQRNGLSEFSRVAPVSPQHGDVSYPAEKRAQMLNVVERPLIQTAFEENRPDVLGDVGRVDEFPDAVLEVPANL